ncbi:transposase [Candidatus Sumerlaeota bacterium]|nr:transposase [Candidatus Sumerlaeota bacterium]
MPEEPPRALNKTLTFGLGLPLAYDARAKTLANLEDNLLKTVYTSLREASETVAMICNIETAKEYAKRILGVPKEQTDAFKASIPAVKRRLDRKTCLSGDAIGQAYMLGSKPHFMGEHGRELLSKGTRQLSTHRTDGTHPIMMRATGTRLFIDDKTFYIAFRIFSAEWAGKNGVSNWIAFPIKIKPRDKTMRGQLERAIRGEWKLKNSRLRKNPRNRAPQWIGQIVVEYTPDPYKTLDPEIVLGIDLGVTVPAALHIRDHGKPLPWAMCIGRGRDMLNTRATIRGDIVRLLRALKSKDSPLDDRSREEAMKKLRELRKREQRVMKTASQRIAGRIADVARRHGAGTWQMEEIGADLKEDKPWLARNWAPGAVKDAVRWQAQQCGATLEFVDPAYTSQRCNKCGHIARENRPKGEKKQAHFECVECGHKDNADKNAARNLSIIGIAEKIREAIKSKSVVRMDETSA